jgi:AcrR family transcriptional regulator
MTTTGTRTRLDLDSRRRQLVDIGLSLFSERAYDEISIDDIAGAAGISKGLLYHYFPSKRDFYVATVRVAADDLRAVTASDPSLSPLDGLRAGLEAYLEYVETHALGFAALMRGGVGSDAQVAAIVDETREAMAARTLDGMPDAVPHTAATHLLVRGWIGLVEAASLEWLARREPPREEVRELLVRAFGAIFAVVAAPDAR